MGLRMEITKTVEAPIFGEMISPANLGGMSLSEVKKLDLQIGNKTYKLDQVFSIEEWQRGRLRRSGLPRKRQRNEKRDHQDSWIVRFLGRFSCSWGPHMDRRRCWSVAWYAHVSW